jgi:hypothetical protein
MEASLEPVILKTLLNLGKLGVVLRLAGVAEPAKLC